MLYILNTGLIPVDWDEVKEANIKMRKISVEEARALLQSEFVSAVGHEATAMALAALLGTEISVNRVAVKMRKGDRAIHFMLKGRLPEGKIITDIDELNQIGYHLLVSEVEGEG